MSGVGWFGDLGNFLVMPTTGELYKVAGKENNDSIKGYRSAYNKATETAKAGYYSVELTDYHIKVESSATPHCGILHFLILRLSYVHHCIRNRYHLPLLY